MAKISSPLTASRALLIAASAKPISTSFCTCCSSGCHNWRQIASYKCIHSIFFKKKITNKSTNTCDTNSKISYRRRDLSNSEDSEGYASIWLLYWGFTFHRKPLWLFISYKQNIWMFLTKKRKEKRKKLNSWMTDAKKIITFILNSIHKIQVNLFGYLYGT